jgi:hypothetical protein
VANVTTWSEQGLGNEIKLGLLNSRFECMLWVVAMLHANVARNAEIIVRAGGAGDKVLLGEFYDVISVRCTTIHTAQGAHLGCKNCRCE